MAMVIRKLVIASVMLLLAACSPGADVQPVVPTVPAVEKSGIEEPQEQVALVARQEEPAATLTPTVTPTITPTPGPSPTPDIFTGWRIDDLALRPYGGTGVVIGEQTYSESAFTQYKITYPADDLTLAGLVNIPQGDGPFPVIIVNHGYGDPAIYYPGYDSATVAGTLARNGYIAVMPDYRGYGESSDGPNPFRLGYVLDVMHLIAQVDTIPGAAPGQIGIIGHSMGGGVSTYPMVLSDEVDAVVMYAAMSGDVAVNWNYIRQWWSAQEMDDLAAIYGTPEQNPSGYASTSATNYLDRVSMPVQIHHATDDLQVPYQWSVDLATGLTAAGKDVTFYTYENAGHTFGGETYNLFMGRVVTFFDEHVRTADQLPIRQN